MKILVTGGAGFIGSHIVEHFHNKVNVCVLDDLSSGFRHNIAAFRHEFVHASILDRDSVRQVMKNQDFVFHLAAMTSVAESMQNPNLCHEVNTMGTQIVLEEAAKAGAKKLILSSSAAVYGDNSVGANFETSPLEPKSPYATSKLNGECCCENFMAEGRLKVVSLRYFNVFGPRQDPANQYAGVVPIFIMRSLRNAPITVFGDGRQTRDFIFVKDVVGANVFFSVKSPATGIFNVASGKCITINDLLRTIGHLSHSVSKIEYCPERSGDIKHSVASIEKLREAGYSPTEDFHEGLKATIEFYKRSIKIS